MNLEEQFQKASELISRSNNILLTMHERMDGDDGGSLLALASELTRQGKNITAAIKKGVPPNLAFLPHAEIIQDDIQTAAQFDLLIVCGCSSQDRTGSELITQLSCPLINIDHHPDNQLYGTINLVDASKSSVAELIYDFFIYNRWPINKQVATCLLTGIITDTGSFMHSNTQASTLKTAAALLKKGAQVSQIVGKTFKNKTPNTLKAWGHALKNSYYDSQQKIIYSIITDEDLGRLGSLPQSAFEGLTETLNTVPEAKFAMFLRQDGDIIKGSLRSDTFKNTDVSKIAKLFGGGGHKLASGFSLAGKLVKDTAGKWQVL